METLFVGNSVILLFWVFITFIVDIKEKFKVVVLMYLITYLTNVFNIVPTIQSYFLLAVALFIDFEFFEDRFKKIIVNNFTEKIIDYTYIVVFEYAYVLFSLSLLLSSDYVIGYASKEIKIVLYIISFLLFCISCIEAASEKYVVHSFDEIKAKIDGIKKYRKFLELENTISNPECILTVEDKNYFAREERYTFLNTFYLKKIYFIKILQKFKRFCKSNEKKKEIAKAIRGYSTIEMQLLRTLAIKEGYDYIYRRKIYELIYARLFWKNLRLYYKKCECPVEPYKDYLLFLYMQCASCLNKGGEERIEEVIKKPRSEILEYTKEELFVLVLCFSGKVKRSNIMEIYEDVMIDMDLDTRKVVQLIRYINE